MSLQLSTLLVSDHLKVVANTALLKTVPLKKKKTLIYKTLFVGQSIILFLFFFIYRVEKK